MKKSRRHIGETGEECTIYDWATIYKLQVRLSIWKGSLFFGHIF